MPELSRRLRDVVDALDLRPGMRVLEVGCGPGAAAREAARLVAPDGFVLAIDRSERAVVQARRGCADEIAAGLLDVRCTTVESFELESGEALFDVAFAARVGALDGRHPELERAARERIAAALVPGAELHVFSEPPTD